MYEIYRSLDLFPDAQSSDIQLSTRYGLAAGIRRIIRPVRRRQRRFHKGGRHFG